MPIKKINKTLSIFLAILLVLNNAAFLMNSALAHPSKVRIATMDPIHDDYTTDLHIWFSAPPSYLSEPSYIYAKTNMTAEKVIFYISGMREAQYIGINRGDNLYSFYWNINEFPNGNYILAAKGFTAGFIAEDYANIEINNFSDTSDYTNDDYTNTDTAASSDYTNDDYTDHDTTAPDYTSDEDTSTDTAPDYTSDTSTTPDTTAPDSTSEGDTSADTTLDYTSDTSTTPDTTSPDSTSDVGTSADTTLDYTSDTSTIPDTTAPDSTSEGDTSADTTDNTASLPIEINFENSQTFFSGDSKVSILLNRSIEQVYFEIEGNGIYKTYQAKQDGTARYYFTWATTDFSNGSYKITAFTIDGTIKNSKSFYGEVVNNNTLETMEIFFEEMTYPLSNDQKIPFSTNQEADLAYILITGSEISKKYTAMKDSSNQYYIILATKEFTNDSYKLSVIVSKDGNEYSKTSQIEIRNTIDYSADDEDITSSETDDNNTNDTTLQEKIEISLSSIPSPLSGILKISAAINNEVNFVYFLIEGGGISKKYEAIKDTFAYFYLMLSSAELPNNHYTLSAVAVKDGNEYIKTTQIEIRNNNDYSTDTSDIDNIYEPSTDIQPDKDINNEEYADKIITTEEEEIYKESERTFELPSLCEQSGITTIEECEKIMSLPQECRFKGINSKEECEKYMSTPPVCREKGFFGETCEKYLHIETITTEILPECTKNGITSAQSCRIFISLSPECRDRGLDTQVACHQYMRIHPECREKGMVSEMECEKYMRMPYECRRDGIINETNCARHMRQNEMPIECREKGITNWEQCNEFMFLKNLPFECKEKGIHNQEECYKFLNNKTFITEECASANIDDPQKCDAYMEANHLPHECKDEGITNKEECDYLLRTKYDNMMSTTEFHRNEEPSHFYNQQEWSEECSKAGIITPEECEKIMFSKHMPYECQEAGITDKEKCDEIMFEKHSPIECKEANISNMKECDDYLRTMRLPHECRETGIKEHNECEKFLFKQHAPPECVEENIFDPEKCKNFMFQKYMPNECRKEGIMTESACKKYIFEKYNATEEMPEDALPLECKKNNAKTLEECEKIMKKLYFPPECKEQGITDDKKCELYLQQKFMPIECHEAGAKNGLECDDIMFKKYAPLECVKAGIETEEECKEFMFNKYEDKIECTNLEDWQCKNSIKSRHLGKITAKQAQTNEIKEKVGHLAGESINVRELKDKLDLTKEIVPIQKEDTKFRVVSANERLILNEDDNIINTSPIALMLDSDQDGLTDDMEKRLGTNPNSADSDGDGYSDGKEVASNYNPLGTGELNIAMASIDKAILNNETLEHPKTEGVETEDLAITNIINIDNATASSTGEGYNFSGKAEAHDVVTIYIYSDLPLVLTTETDEYGNWKYELNQSLLDGEHEIYVAINDDTGKITKKSSPLNFFVKEARAISIKDFLASPDISSETSQSTAQKTKNLIKYYIFIAIFIIILGIVIFVLFIIQKKKKSQV